MSSAGALSVLGNTARMRSVTSLRSVTDRLLYAPRKRIRWLAKAASRASLSVCGVRRGFLVYCVVSLKPSSMSCSSSSSGSSQLPIWFDTSTGMTKLRHASSTALVMTPRRSRSGCSTIMLSSSALSDSFARLRRLDCLMASTTSFSRSTSVSRCISMRPRQKRRSMSELKNSSSPGTSTSRRFVRPYRISCASLTMMADSWSA
mmetsp:Transcript_27187/g.85547  ORF Transcript_27187/g.85547 Transcript_27187/m.85547 type:complete len:204 (-) Transcript_27187:689-1300(-)